MGERFPTFEGYVEVECGGWTEGGKCSGCMREDAPRLTAGLKRGKFTMGAGDCEWCVRYHYGYDQAESFAVRSVIYGAVRQALKDEIPLSLIRRAVDEAQADDHSEQLEEQIAKRIEAGSL